MQGIDLSLPFEEKGMPTSGAQVGPGRLEVWHLADGRKLLRLPDGWGLKWYELNSEQASWLAEQLSKSDGSR